MIILRIFKEGLELFKTRPLITITNIFIIFLTGLLIFASIIGYHFIDEGIKYVRTKLDFAIYFKEDASREDIQKLKGILENFNGVDKVEFITKEKAFEEFQSRFLSNPSIVRALSELNINPFVDYLIVKSNDPIVYEEIAKYLENSPYRAIIDFLTYSENRNVINRFIKVSNQLKYFLFLAAILLLSFSSLIIFNSTVLAIYSQKDEIEVLKLIGAPSYFIRLPFLISQLISTIIGFLISQGVFIFLLIKTRNFWSSILVTLNPELFYFNNFWTINLIILAFLSIITIVSTSLAIQKYLKI